MAKSTYLDNKDLDHNLGTTTFTKPTAVYLALFNGNPASGGTEATGGSYARQAITFSAASAGTATSNVACNFTNMPATTVNYVGIYDASTAGNLLYAQSVTSKTTNVGDTVQFASGAVTVSES